jgi:5'-nucleotidase
MKSKRTIAVDMDGVIADVENHFITWYHQEYGLKIPYENLIGKAEGEAFPEKDAVKQFVRSPGSVAALKELMANFEIYIVSTAVEFPQSLPEKLEWLHEHFPFISWRNIIFCGNKNVINTDYMIDDHCKNLDNFKGQAILFNAAHNTEVAHHYRVHSWPEIISLLK